MVLVICHGNNESNRHFWESLPYGLDKGIGRGRGMSTIQDQPGLVRPQFGHLQTRCVQVDVFAGGYFEVNDSLDV